jgi:dTDP-4-dehydrorhamnose reductase
MRIMILGAKGLIGGGLLANFGKDWTVIGRDKTAVDVTDPGSIRRALATDRPDAVINCTAFMNVDRCELEPAQSHLVNCLGSIHIANAIRASADLQHCAFIQLSSDFVFDGRKGDYSEEDAAKPLSYYGVHKIVADEYIANVGLPRYYVLRVASMIGFVPARNNFVKRMISLAKERDHFDIVNDLTISMSTPEFLADAISRLLHARAPSGVYNTVAAGQTTWYEMLVESFKILGIKHDIRPTSIETMPNAHLRPRKSNMVVAKFEKATRKAVDHWRHVLRRHIEAHRQEYERLANP